MAVQERGGLGILCSEALRPRDRLHSRALQGSLEFQVGCQAHRRDRVPYGHRAQQPCAGAPEGGLPRHRRLPAAGPDQALARGWEHLHRRAGVDAHLLLDHSQWP